MYHTAHSGDASMPGCHRGSWGSAWKAGVTPRARYADWMRESAHWADSARNGSVEAESFLRSVQILTCWLEPRTGAELPRAMQAFRTRPRHFVRLTGLPRKMERNCSSLIAASHSSRGKSKDSTSGDSPKTAGACSEGGECVANGKILG